MKVGEVYRTSLDPVVVCPACGEPNKYAEDDGAVDGPREYHAGCWVHERKYTTTGPVTGDCGHSHRTLEAANKCRLRHSKNCRKHGGYSDRSVRAISCGDIVKLTAGEYAICERLEFR